MEGESGASHLPGCQRLAGSLPETETETESNHNVSLISRKDETSGTQLIRFVPAPNRYSLGRRSSKENSNPGHALAAPKRLVAPEHGGGGSGGGSRITFHAPRTTHHALAAPERSGGGSRVTLQICPTAGKKVRRRMTPFTRSFAALASFV
jgi:hypothetical protein